VQPTVGYEFVANRELAAALQHIPVDGSLLVTNDTRFPANGFVAEDMQLQLPALFGHHAYFVDAVNDKFDAATERRRRQSILRRDSWNSEAVALARSEGWTHFVVRRDYVHPRTIPLPLVFENREYAIYTFSPIPDVTLSHQ
jgi:hypothetical protein